MSTRRRMLLPQKRGGVNEPYITILSDSRNEVSISCTLPNWDNIVYISTDAENWNVWDGSLVSGYNIYIKGKKNTVLGKIWSTDSTWNLNCASNDVHILGSIKDARDYTGTTNMGSAAYASLFKNNTCLFYIDDIPDEPLQWASHDSMFAGCTSLRSCPKLYPSVLSTSCYSGMFQGCTSLEVIDGPLDGWLASNCYTNMFNGCTSLMYCGRNLLPRTDLFYQCYSSMFANCSSLIENPFLPARTLENSCYEMMFANCTSLYMFINEGHVERLPAKNLASRCYSGMFQGSGIRSVPTLPATTLADYCYNEMFSNCYNIEYMSALPATTLAPYCYNRMFAWCMNAPFDSLPALPAQNLQTWCYANMFEGCYTVKVSATNSSTYYRTYRIPSVGTATDADNATRGMFWNTGGTFQDTPAINTNYYTNKVIIS